MKRHQKSSFSGVVFELICPMGVLFSLGKALKPECIKFRSQAAYIGFGLRQAMESSLKLEPVLLQELA